MSDGTKGVKRLRDINAEATRKALVEAAAKRFASDGHAGTSLDDVAGDVGTTKGAVYHHFKDKKALFLAAYELLSQDLIASLSADPRMQESTVAGPIGAFLVLATQDRYRRVLFVEGPAVLGSKVCREIDMRYAFGLLARMVGRYGVAELLPQVSIGVLSNLLIALLIEGAQLISASEDQAQTAQQVELLLTQAIESMSRPLSNA